MQTGTLTLVNGKTVKATRWGNGTVTYEQSKMIRHGNSSSVQGFVQRKASVKQIATFVVSTWETDIVQAEILAYVEKAEREPVIIKTVTPEKVAYARMSNFIHLADVAPTASARAFWTRQAERLVLAA